ncbi:unnamed protein product [Kluyveromyces dobzhanskii CBS 2104]|uniref:Protein transport protein SEC31 n=1 Tax=Kluyveromyces dobzhanskii CBS 2104 TaxID=1427455 RepID=A0A0A8L911_9SACH|nr:unnamed protein product [Kluyveromyces dobzhanskii CBS 2104]
MVKLAEYPRTATFSWSHDRVPVLATGTASGAIDADFSSTSSLEFWSLLSFDGSKPSGSVIADAKFNDLDWSNDDKIVAGALENGVVEFFDPKALKSIAKVHKHQGPVKALRFNAKQNNVLVSGGTQGEIYIWDSNKIGSPDYSPFSSGVSNSPIDEVSSLAWNQSLAHVFASASSSGYTSVWDLKAKKQVLHLNHNSSTTGIKVPLTAVDWHPTSSTIIATASNSDTDPLVLTWDLRNAHVPLQVLSQGHSKGVLSLDWCKQDENLLLSSSRDNTSVLWNPQDGSILTQFAPRGNWVFKSKFAPEAPDLFASASFDSKIIVQTLQNLSTSLDAQANESKQQASEDEFWQTVTTNSVDDKPNTIKVQAPKWYGNKSPAAQWAFGGKLVKISDDGKGISIVRPSVSGLEKNELFDESLKSKDFVKLINKRLSQKINSTNEEDWNLLENLSMDGTEDYLKEALSLDDANGDSNKSQEDGAEFFDQLNDSFSPEGLFKLDFSDSVKPITDSLVKGDLKSALNLALEKDMLLEAFVIAITSGDSSLADKAKNVYFTKHCKQSSLARTLFSVAQNDVEDIVENTDVSQWKDAVQFIFTYTKDVAKKNSLLVKLGDRLQFEGNRKDAILLYLAGQSLDNIASIWLEEFPEFETHLTSQKDTLYEAHLECLTEFVERFTVLSDYLDKGAVKLNNQELISKFLEFVNVTATNGDFDLALRFLETLPDDNEAVKSEKQRVLIASGKTSSTKTAGKVLDNTAQSRSGRYVSASTPASAALPRLSNAGIPAQNPLPSVNQPAVTMAQNVIPRQPSFAAQTAPLAPASNPYAPAAISQTTAQSTTGSRPSYTPAINPYANVASSVPPNPYAPPSAASPAPFAPPIAPPPIAGARGYSGQTPHLHEKPIDGWNDLPSVSREKPTRAKAVNTAPIGMSTPSYGTPDPAFAPTPLSRTNTNPTLPPPPSHIRRTPKPASPAAVASPPLLKKTNSYAPNIVPVQPSQPPQSIANPLLPPTSPNPAAIGRGFVPPVNPYGPPPISTTATGIAPLKPTMSNISSPLPVSAPKVASAPPPMKMNRKSTAVGDANAANNLLGSIQSKPTPSTYSPAMVEPAPATQVPSTVSPTNTETVSQQANGITESDRPIAEFFTAELQRVTPLIPQEYTKQLKDCDKRIKILIKHLENHDLLTQPTIDKLHQIVALWKDGKYSEAMTIHQDLSANHSSEAGNWLTGVKRLMNIADATSSQ